MAQLNQQQLIIPGIIIMIQFIKCSSTWQLIAPLDFRVQEEEQGELCYFCGRNPIKYIILHKVSTKFPAVVAYFECAHFYFVVLCVANVRLDRLLY